VSDLGKIPEDLKAIYKLNKQVLRCFRTDEDAVKQAERTIALIERIAQQDALLREYRNNHFPEGHKCRLYRDGEDLRCDLCKRTDQQLQPKGEQG